MIQKQFNLIYKVMGKTKDKVSKKIPKKERLKVSLPESLADITVGQYLKFRKYNISADSDNDFVTRKVLQAFYDIPADKHDGINSKDLSVVVQAVLKVMDDKSHIHSTFEMGGIKWGLIPNIDEITFGEYVDMKSIKPDEFDKLLAILYRPVVKEDGDKYEIEAYQGWTEYYRQMHEAPLSVLYGVFTFFFGLLNDMMNSTLNSMKGQLKKMQAKQKQKQTSPKSGDGMQALKNLQALTSLSLMPWQDYLHIKL